MDGKTTEIYLIRHGESQANEKDVFLGELRTVLPDNV